MSVFVTGASGFLGRAVVDELLVSGYEVCALSRNTSAVNDAAFKHDIDITCVEEMAKLPWDKCEAVIHLAAAGVKNSSRTMHDCIWVNVVGTQMLLNTVSLYAPEIPVYHARTYYEDFIGSLPALQNNSYVTTKAAAWRLAKEWASVNPSRNIAAFRVFQVYGPGDDIKNVLTYAAAQLAANRKIEIGSGKSEKDWIFVKDAASAIVHLLKVSGKGVSEFDIGTGSLRSVKNVVEKLTHLKGFSADSISFDPSKDRPDTEIKMCAKLLPPGWSPVFSLDTGLMAL